MKGDVDKIKGEGMPQHEYSSYHGVNFNWLSYMNNKKDLFVEYKVRLPEKLTSEQIKRNYKVFTII